MPYLVIQPGKINERAIELGSAPTLLGREPQCHVSVADATLSGRHATVWTDRDRWYLADLRSTNGTFLNRQLVPPLKAIELREGDAIEFGSVSARFVRVPEDADERRPLIEAKDRELAELMLLLDERVRELDEARSIVTAREDWTSPAQLEEIVRGLRVESESTIVPLQERTGKQEQEIVALRAELEQRDRRLVEAERMLSDRADWVAPSQVDERVAQVRAEAEAVLAPVRERMVRLESDLAAMDQASRTAIAERDEALGVLRQRVKASIEARRTELGQLSSQAGEALRKVGEAAAALDAQLATLEGVAGGALSSAPTVVTRSDDVVSSRPHGMHGRRNRGRNWVG